MLQNKKVRYEFDHRGVAGYRAIDEETNTEIISIIEYRPRHPWPTPGWMLFINGVQQNIPAEDVALEAMFKEIEILYKLQQIKNNAISYAKEKDKLYSAIQQTLNRTK